ncbi:MAG: OmpA family protein [Hyphomicrobiaceae bacterium]
MSIRPKGPKARRAQPLLIAALAVAASPALVSSEAAAQAFRPQQQQDEPPPSQFEPRKGRGQGQQGQGQQGQQGQGQRHRGQDAPQQHAPRQGRQGSPDAWRAPGRGQAGTPPPQGPAPGTQPGRDPRQHFGRDRRHEAPPPATAEPPRRDPGGRLFGRDRRHDSTPPVAAEPRRDGHRGRDRDTDRGDVRHISPAERVERRRERREWRARNDGPVLSIDALRQGRREERLRGGGVVLQEPDARRIYRGDGRRLFIQRDETRRLRRFARDLDTRRGSDGRTISSYRRHGVEIFTETGPDGHLIRRWRRGPGGREVYLIDNRRTWRRWGTRGGLGLAINIGPPILSIPRHRYIVEYDGSSYDDIYDALSAPPMMRLDRGYTLDEVLATAYLRDRMRRIDLDSINFAFGSWQVDESQYDDLERIARAINRLIQDNPDEIVLVEGHTDAVGDDVDNLTLSDRRAEEVASILSEEFDIPPENLVTQGYGEEFLKVDTDGPERANRRVTIRRITPLLSRNTAYRDRD